MTRRVGFGREVLTGANGTVRLAAAGKGSARASRWTPVQALHSKPAVPLDRAASQLAGRAWPCASREGVCVALQRGRLIHRGSGWFHPLLSMPAGHRASDADGLLEPVRVGRPEQGVEPVGQAS
jgi:hypothetical protein